jgi:hypothetical protein
MAFATDVTRAALAALADFAGPLGSGTTVSGAVSGIWTASNGPYFVADTIHVPENSSLTIQPGVLVVFQGRFPLRILGNATLKALGTSQAPVIFTSTDHINGWAGLRFLEASDSCRLEYSTISYALNAGASQYTIGGGVFCDQTNVTFDHCLIHHCQAVNGGALALENNSHAQISYITITGNSAQQGPGIYCEASSPVITNSILWDAGGEIYAAGSSNPQVIYSDVFGGYSGSGNLNTDPLFVDPASGNYHLQSVVGSYSGGAWVANPGYSPLIDAADPAAPFNLEPEPNGDHADMGSYGNTPQASLSLQDPHYAFGEVSGNWTTVHSPMHVISDIYVPAGQTLSISPGVQVIFEGQYSLSISQGASLIAEGTPQDSIFFVPANTSQGWEGLRFNQAGDSCRLAFCRLSYATLSSGNGGGIHCDSSSLVIHNSTIEHCRANNGAGLYAVGSDLEISGCLFTADSAAGGGALYAQNCQLAISTSSFLDNSATNGAALSLWFDQAQISNCVFAQDTASAYGAAIYNLNTSLTLTNCVVADNRSNPVGVSGAIHALGASTVAVQNCILWNNAPQQLSAISGATAQVNYSDVMGGWTGTGSGNLDVDPAFQPGPFSAWQLAATSPVVDAGNPDPAFNDPEDPLNPGQPLYPALGTLRNDMGAYGGPGASGILSTPEQPQPPTPPRTFSLSQNWPNPFNPTTVISYQLAAFSHVRLKVYDTAGKLVTTLVEGQQEMGTHTATFNGSSLASGVYLIRLQAGKFTATRKLILLK